MTITHDTILKAEFERLFPEEAESLRRGGKTFTKQYTKFLFAACVWRGFKAGKDGIVEPPYKPLHERV